MSGAGAQLARLPGPSGLPKGRSPLAHLLHALNQPLTGLQCSLELAVAGPQRTEQYIRTLREGLELTGRMRVLVEAIRELTDIQQAEKKDAGIKDGRIKDAEPFLLEALLRQTCEELTPVAEAKRVQLKLVSEFPLPVHGERRSLAELSFRFLESALSLTEEGEELRILALAERGHACLVVSWPPATAPEHSPFSPAELGLLIAQVGWEQAGAEWDERFAEGRQSCMIRLPLASGEQAPDTGREIIDGEILK